MNDAIALARRACETMMRRFAPQNLPPKGHFHYHQGVFLWGMLQVWQLDGNKEFLDYARGWLDAVLGPDGTPRDFVPGELDDIQPGNLLFPVWEATGDPRYRRAMDAVYAQYARIPRCACGGYCHKPDLPGQMWLDGLYMGGPFLARYAALTGQPVLWQQVAEQIFLMARNTRDDATGLWRHAWDETLRTPWADPGTGCSPEFWGRSLGWVPLALLDDLDAMPAGFAPPGTDPRPAAQSLPLSGGGWTLVSGGGQSRSDGQLAGKFLHLSVRSGPVQGCAAGLPALLAAAHRRPRL